MKNFFETEFWAQNKKSASKMVGKGADSICYVKMGDCHAITEDGTIYQIVREQDIDQMIEEGGYVIENYRCEDGMVLNYAEDDSNYIHVLPESCFDIVFSERAFDKDFYISENEDEVFFGIEINGNEYYRAYAKKTDNINPADISRDFMNISEF